LIGGELPIEFIGSTIDINPFTRDGDSGHQLLDVRKVTKTCMSFSSSFNSIVFSPFGLMMLWGDLVKYFTKPGLFSYSDIHGDCRRYDDVSEIPAEPVGPAGSAQIAQ